MAGFAQSDGTEQVVRQVPEALLQAKGAQLIEAPMAQVLVASHFGTRQLLRPTHALGPQAVPNGYLVHPPRPSHRPLVPQVETG